jgi:hypothetical protein
LLFVFIPFSFLEKIPSRNLEKVKPIRLCRVAPIVQMIVHSCEAPLGCEAYQCDAKTVSPDWFGAVRLFSVLKNGRDYR